MAEEISIIINHSLGLEDPLLPAHRSALSDHCPEWRITVNDDDDNDSPPLTTHGPPVIPPVSAGMSPFPQDSPAVERSIVYCSPEQKASIKDLEKKKESIMADQAKVDKRGGDIQGLYGNGLGLMVLLAGIGGLMPKHAEICSVVLFLLCLGLMYVTGVGINAYTTVRKILKKQWDMDAIAERKIELKGEVEEMKAELSRTSVPLTANNATTMSVEVANGRLNSITAALDRDVYADDHMTFVIVTSVVAILYLVALDFLLYHMFSVAGARTSCRR